MKRLLIQACSQRKKNVDRKDTPLVIYTGQFFRVFHKFKGNQDITVVVISARYGMLTQDDLIEYYEEKMDKIRMKQLQPIIHEKLSVFLENNQFDEIFLSLSKLYLSSLGDLKDIPQHDKFIFCHPGGIGKKLQSLKLWLINEPQRLNTSTNINTIYKDVNEEANENAKL